MPMLAQFGLPGDTGERLALGVLKLGLAVSVLGAAVWLGLRVWRHGSGALRQWPHWLAGLAILQALLGLLVLDAIAAWGGIWLGAQSLVVVILSLFEDHPLAESLFRAGR